MRNLLYKIKSRNAKIGIIGLGYAGLPLAIAFASKFKVIGYDVNEKKIELLRKGRSYTEDVSGKLIKKYLGKTFFPTSKPELNSCDVFIICVQTPLDERREPDLAFVRNAATIVAENLREETLVVLESTTFPGTTDDILIPILEESGYHVGDDFYVAYSPERIDPGNRLYNVENTPKIVGGVDKQSTEIAAKLYGEAVESVVKVSDCKTAEATKIVENIFRDVNIALVNELALISERIGIDIWEVIKAASTKPYGYTPFYPGPGVGGHCIPVDPYYLSYKAKKEGYVPRFIELSGEVNDYMITHAVNLTVKALKETGRKVRGSKIALLGLSYKKNIADTRGSPAVKATEELIKMGAEIKAYDPFASSINTKYGTLHSEENIEDTLRGANCALFLVDHSAFKRLKLNKRLMKNPVIIDCKNVFNKDKLQDFNYYGIGKR